MTAELSASSFVSVSMRLLIVSMCLVLAATAASAADLSGRWQFSVDLDNGGHGDPVFNLEQKGDLLTGTYLGPLGEHKVTGTVKGDKAEIVLKFEREGEMVTGVYSGKVESDRKMSGTVNFGGGAQTGKWVATRQ
jgi:hypothetical protein